MCTARALCVESARCLPTLPQDCYSASGAKSAVGTAMMGVCGLQSRLGQSEELLKTQKRLTRRSVYLTEEIDQAKCIPSRNSLVSIWVGFHLAYVWITLCLTRSIVMAVILWCQLS